MACSLCKKPSHNKLSCPNKQLLWEELHEPYRCDYEAELLDAILNPEPKDSLLNAWAAFHPRAFTYVYEKAEFQLPLTPLEAALGRFNSLKQAIATNPSSWGRMSSLELAAYKNMGAVTWDEVVRIAKEMTDW